MKKSSSALIKSLIAVCLLAVGLNKAAASVDTFGRNTNLHSGSEQIGATIPCEFPDGGENF